MANPTVLTEKQKLSALALKFYQGMQWKPEAGHFYTTSRADLELYRIAKIENGIVYTEYCTNPGVFSEWAESEFIASGFGLRRVWVPDFIFVGIIK